MVYFLSHDDFDVVEVTLEEILLLLFYACYSIQLFRQRLSRKSVKAYATTQIGVMDSSSFA